MAREPDAVTELRRALGDKLATFRQAAGLTQADIGKAAFCDRTRVAHIERGSGRADEQFWSVADGLCCADCVLLAGFHGLEAVKQEHELQQRQAQTAEARARADAYRRRLAVALEEAHGGSRPTPHGNVNPAAPLPAGTNTKPAPSDTSAGLAGSEGSGSMSPKVRSMREEQRRLSAKLRSEHNTWGEVAVIFCERYRVNMLTAFRLAHGWSQRDVADRWNNRWPEDLKTSKNSPATPIRIQLASQEANAAALLGNANRAREALRRAEIDAETIPADSGMSAWSFPAGRQAIFALSVAIQTGDPDAALRAVAMADAGWASGDPIVPANWAQIRVGAGIAHLSKGSLEQAIKEVAPVFTLAPELRISTVTAYMENLDRQLRKPQLQGSNDAAEFRQSIRDFNLMALPDGQPTEIE
jgi:transcriptional regulator with XRE-family HTH domain